MTCFFLLIIMEFSISTLQFVKIIFVSAHQVEGEEHDWEYHATVFVYITSPHAKDLQNEYVFSLGEVFVFVCITSLHAEDLRNN